jgi:hypothetical protein
MSFDLARHPTHWRVRADVRQSAERLQLVAPCSWNTYLDHPEGMHLDATSIDLWHTDGRGVPLPEHTGDALCSWALGQHQVRPIRWLIWWGWWWRPGIGWQIYNGWQGSHKGKDAHIHITYE